MFLNSMFLMSGGLVQALQLLGGLSFLIALHEFGHFFFARLFKTRVEKFYLFFDFLFPFSGLLNFALFKKTKGETEYGIGWFPLGGYVKIAGMIDESMDKEAMALPPQPWEFRSKKAYERLLIMLGGILMNVIIAIVLYMLLFGIWGENYTPTANARYGISTDSTGYFIGFREGDQVKFIDGKPISRLEEAGLALVFHSDNATIVVNRDGKDTTFQIPKGTISRLMKHKSPVLGARAHAIIDTVLPGSIAVKAGFKKGDSILSVNDQPMQWGRDFIKYRAEHEGQPLAIAYARDGKIDTIHTMCPKDSLLGVLVGSGRSFYVHKTYNPVEAIGKGFSEAANKLRLYVIQFKLFVSPEVKINESVGGFYSMGKLYNVEFNWPDFIGLTAFISIALAFMNLLPIPGLDGGYVIFLLFEMLTGKRVSEKFMERATTVGLVLLLALMVYVNGLDVLKILHIKV